MMQADVVNRVCSSLENELLGTNLPQLDRTIHSDVGKLNVADMLISIVSVTGSSANTRFIEFAALTNAEDDAEETGEQEELTTMARDGICLMHLPGLGKALITHIERVVEVHLLGILRTQLLIVISNVDVLSGVLNDARMHASAASGHDELGRLGDRLS